MLIEVHLSRDTIGENTSRANNACTYRPTGTVFRTRLAAAVVFVAINYIHHACARWRTKQYCRRKCLSK